MKRRVVEGSVVDESGNPVAGAFVSIKAQDVSVMDIASVTSADGRFKLALPPGDFSVSAVTRTGLTGTAKLSKFNHLKFSPIIHLHP